ncbi:hypothetical protein KKD62_00125, partial [Patescibacteria group bacterium]|nr:hypothetical protein [Patescibacteria group bacterium]MBU1931383.1 hypothetical protein [Patescibacteria group bacterium]
MNLDLTLTPENLAAYQQHLRDSGLAPSSVKRKAESIKRLADWSEKTGLIKTNRLKKGSPQAKPEENRLKFLKNLLKYGTLTLILLFLLWLIFNNRERWFSSEPPVSKMPSMVPAAQASYSPWIIFYKGKISGRESTIDQAVTAVFQVYDQSKGGESLWTSKNWQLEANDEGVFSAPIGDTTRGDKEIPDQLFFQNDRLYLGISINGQELSPRSPISSAGHSADAYTLQEHQPAEEAGAGNIPVLNEQGHLLLAAPAPKIQALNNTFAIEGQAITLQTPFASDGNITLAPDGSGTIQLITSNTQNNSLNIHNANLNTGSLIGGWLANNNSTPNLINLSSGTNQQEQFAVSADGNMQLTGSANIGKNLALGQQLYHLDDRDTLLEFDHNSLKIDAGGDGFLHFSQTDQALIGNYKRDGLDFNWLGQTDKASAFFIDSSTGRVGIGTTSPERKLDVKGSAAFDEDVRINRFLTIGSHSTNPGSAEEGTLIYNTTDDKVYYYTGGGWVEVSASFWQRNNNSLAPAAITDSVGIGTTTPTEALEVIGDIQVSGVTQFGGISNTTYNAISDSGTATYASSDNDLYIEDILEIGNNLHLPSSANLIFGGTTSLGETTAANDSGAYVVGIFDEFDNSDSVNVQDVLDDLDAEISGLSAGTSGLWQTGTYGTYENDAAVIVGPDADFTYITEASDDLRVASEAEILGGLYVGTTDYLHIENDGDVVFVDADGGASITGPAGGALTVSAGASQNLDINDVGTVTFETNGETLTNGTNNYLTSSAGFSVGGAATYYFDTSGNLNANAGTFAGTLTLNSVGADTANTVLILNGSNQVTSDEIDSDVWTGVDNYQYWILKGDSGGDQNVTSTYIIDFGNDGDGIDTTAAANALTIAVDVTDILGTGLTESSNNIDIDQAYNFSWTGTHSYSQAVNIGGVTGLAYNAMSDSGVTSHSLASDDDLYTEGDLEVDGTIYADNQICLNGDCQSAWPAGGTNYWDRTSGVLSPATVGDVLAATASATTVATLTASGSNLALRAGDANDY